MAGHTFFLEELGLKPGDLVSYYARARDNGGNGQEAKTDIYFMSVRPFDQTYKQSEQAGGGGGGGGDDPGELTERQRQVVAGTFNVDRDRKTTPANRLRENFATLNLSQGRVREAVETLVRRIMERNITAIDTAFKIIAEELPQAAKEMQVAEEKLLARNSADALPPEQRALQHLQRAEAAFKEYQIQRGQPQGGGGGGNKQSNAEDLADLFELDADKLRNQYETVDRGTPAAAGGQPGRRDGRKAQAARESVAAGERATQERHARPAGSAERRRWREPASTGRRSRADGASARATRARESAEREQRQDRGERASAAGRGERDASVRHRRE